MDGTGPTATLHWLGIGPSLLTAAVRCILQLTLVAIILQSVFDTRNPIGVAGIALLLNFLGTFEVVMNKSKRRHQYMFPSVFIGLLLSTGSVATIGTKIAMSVNPFWTPAQYIPVVGMLCGSAVSGVILSVGYILKELHENRDKVEVYLAFGASRIEACRPIAKDALGTALTPVINQMSLLGIVAIPGMMTGALLGGASVQQAVRLQMIIMFMLSSATTMASIFTTMGVVAVVIDGDHRIRTDRMHGGAHPLWRARAEASKMIMEILRAWFCSRRNSKRNGVMHAPM